MILPIILQQPPTIRTVTVLYTLNKDPCMTLGPEVEIGPALGFLEELLAWLRFQGCHLLLQDASRIELLLTSLKNGFLWKGFVMI